MTLVKIVTILYIVRLAYMDYSGRRFQFLDLALLFVLAAKHIDEPNPIILLALLTAIYKTMASYLEEDNIFMIPFSVADIYLFIILASRINLALLCSGEYILYSLTYLSLTTLALVSWTGIGRLPYFYILSPIILYLALMN